MASNRTIRVGIVGAGKNTRDRHIPGLKAMENVEIISVANRTLASSQNAATALDIPQAYSNWRELVYADDTNAIVIGTWPYMHHPVTLAALDAGKHVMVEARMAMNYQQATEMLAASRAHPELITQIVPSPMTLHLDNTIKRLIAEGYLGEIIALDVRVSEGFADFDGLIHWRYDMTLSGLNILSMGIWYEAIMRWVGQAKTVMAVGQQVVKTRKDAEGQLHTINIPDHLNIIAEMVNGAQMSMLFSSATGLAEGSGVWIYGTYGTLRIYQDKLYGGQRGDPQLTEIEIPPEESQGWRVEEEFIQAIRGQEDITHTTFEVGAAYMMFTEAVHRSMASGQKINLPFF